MARQFEKAGIPTVQLCTMTSIARSLGVPRIVPGLGIPHPVGNPRLSKDEERKVRKALVRQALEVLCREVGDQEASA